MKKLLIAALAAASFIMIPALGSEAHAFPPIRDNGMISRLQKERQDEANKELVVNFWNEVFNRHNASIIDTAVGDVYTQHSPGFADGKEAFKTAISGFLAEFPESTAEIKRVAADGDLVFIHNHIKLNAADRGQSAVDIFRVENGKIVEHWDIIQDVPEKAENNNTMF